VSKPERASLADVLAYRQRLVDQLAPASAARCVSTIRAFHKWAVVAGLAKSDPAAAVKPPRIPRDREPEHLSTDEVRRLLAAVDSSARHAKRDRAMLMTLAYTGIRVSELCNLDIGDVITRKDKALAAIRVRGESAKGSKERVIPLADPAHRAILSYLEERDDAGKDVPLFVCRSADDDDRRLSIRAFQWLFARYSERAGIDEAKRHPHILRHSAAMRWLYESRAPGGLFTVSKLLGHSSVSTTQVYLSADRQAQEQAVIGDPLNLAA